ncbi:MAG: hypothetical protein Q7U47_01340 [Paludibacter sp.]|nr:hypothetical protein [Paludibacter sp.]
MNGLLENLVKKSAMFFLYVFINPTSTLPAIILKKRKVQVQVLKLIAGADLFRSYDYYIKLVYAAIVAQYKLTPHQMLDAIYKAATTPQIKGIGTPALSNVDLIETGTGVSDIYFADGKVEKGTSSQNVWSDIAKIIQWIVQLIRGLKADEKDKKAGPNDTDWAGLGLNKPNTTTADISSYLPYIVILGIGITLLTSSQSGSKSKSSSKSKK